MTISVNVLGTILAAAALYLLGTFIVKHVSFLARYCIPAPLVGGLIFAVINTVLYSTGNHYFTFDSHIQTFLMVVFFTCVGFTARVNLLKAGGKAVMMALLLASILTLMQNGLGAGVLMAFGEDPRLGLAVGSIALVGGPGTAASFGPVLEAAGAAGGSVIGIAAATFGLVVGSLLGGPTADYLARKYGLSGPSETVEESVETKVTKSGNVQYRAISIICIIAFCMGAGYVLGGAFTALTGVTLPWFVASMFMGALVRNTTSVPDDEFPDDEADKIGNVCLCGFLSMAMMSLKIWDLAELAGPLIVALILQTVLMMWFSLYIVFPRLGRDYDAAVMTAGFIGFSMGATSNAMANMQAVTNKYGPSPTSFLVIPLVGGMAIDFVNIFVVSALIPLLGALA